MRRGDGGPPEDAVSDLVVVQALGVAGWFSFAVVVPAGVLVLVGRARARDWPAVALVVVVTTVSTTANVVLGIWLVAPEGIRFGP